MFSIIIPTYNEADQLACTIGILHERNHHHQIEIIVADGGSTDRTVEIAKECSAIVIVCQRKGRAAQMNEGASVARGEILYFLHADSIPPHGFTTQIFNEYNNGIKSGCFRLKFDYDHWFLKANAWFTRLDINAVRFGDQSLFVSKEVFERSGKFREDLIVMEDQEIISRIKKFGRFKVLDDVVVTSARKYRDNGIYRMQGIFYRIWTMYYMGFSQEKMLAVYRRLINKHKQ